VLELSLSARWSLQSAVCAPRMAATPLAFGRNLMHDQYLVAYPVGQRRNLAESSDGELVRWSRSWTWAFAGW
jgi:hypothetical protein